MSLASLHQYEHHIPPPNPFTTPLPNKLPSDIILLSPSKQSPFPYLYEPNSDEVLISLNGEEILIWTDGSAFPNPGNGGCGLFVQDGENTSYSYPNPKITTNNEEEINGISRAIDLIKEQYSECQRRIIILTDSKLVLDALMNKISLRSYEMKIRECQTKFNNLFNIPEIYWVKSHSGIYGNEQADKAAVHARIQATNISSKTFTHNNRFLNNHGLNEYLTNSWNDEWCNESNREEHQFTKNLIGNLSIACHLEKFILHSLQHFELRIICRLITGKVRLNKYLYSIKQVYSPICPCGEEEESIEHFLLECKLYSNARHEMINKLSTIHFEDIDLRLLLAASSFKDQSIRIAVLKNTCQFVIKTNREI